MAEGDGEAQSGENKAQGGSSHSLQLPKEERWNQVGLGLLQLSSKTLRENGLKLHQGRFNWILGDLS